MVYTWDEHRETCYRLYVTENASINELMEYMATNHAFTPSKRAFQHQLRKWNFPVKQNGAHHNTALSDRVRELWETNCSHSDMLRILREEDYQVSARQLLRLRSHYRLYLRVHRATAAADKQPVDRQDKGDGEDDQDKYYDDEGGGKDNRGETKRQDQPPPPPPSPPKMTRTTTTTTTTTKTMTTTMSKTKTKARTARRSSSRGTPRYPSENTVADSKAVLGLDASAYRLLRTHFHQICGEAGLESKRSVGYAAWEQAKAKLVERMPSLESSGGSGPTASYQEVARRKLALDIICTDVTKRMRSREAAAGRNPSLAEIRNTLGVNPDEARHMRAALAEILRKRRVATVGGEMWRDVMAQWRESCLLLSKALADERQFDARTRAAELLARDVLKRWRDATARERAKQRIDRAENLVQVDGKGRQERREQEPHEDEEEDDDDDNEEEQEGGDEDNEEEEEEEEDDDDDDEEEEEEEEEQEEEEGEEEEDEEQEQEEQQQQQNVQEKQLVRHDGAMMGHDVWDMYESAGLLSHSMDSEVNVPLPDMNGLEISHMGPLEPSLLNGGGAHGFMDHEYMRHLFSPMAIYLQPHPSSTVMAGQDLWIGMLPSSSSATLDDVRAAAVENYPEAICLAVEGLLRDNTSGLAGVGEVPLPIQSDAELAAYLQYMQQVGRAPTFCVDLHYRL